MTNNLMEQVKSILPESLVGRGSVSGVFGKEPPERGDEQLLKMYSKTPWLRAVANKIGREVAKNDWQLFVSRDAQGRAFFNKNLVLGDTDVRSKEIKRALNLEEVELVSDHPFLDMISFGNEAMSGLVAMQVTQIHLDLLGEAFWLLERNNAGTPVAFWPMPPTWVRDLPNRERLSFIVNAEGHRSSEVEIPITEIIHFKDPDPSQPYARGTGVARSLGDELEIHEFSGKHAKNVFWNRARPDLVITGDNFSREEAERVEKKWKDNHRGFMNSMKPIFINRDVTVKELTQSFESMQLTNLRQDQRDTILQVFGVPPDRVGVLSQANRSTIDASEAIFQGDVIVPRLELIRAEMQRQLIPQFDDRLILHFPSPVKEDRELQLQIMRAAPWAFSANRWRHLAGEEELPEDFLLIPANETPVPVDNPIAGAAEGQERLVGYLSVDRGKEEEDKNKDLPSHKSKIEGRVKRRIAKQLAGRLNVVH